MINRLRKSLASASLLLWIAVGLLIIIVIIGMLRFIFPDSSTDTAQAATTRQFALAQRGGVAAVITTTGIVNPAREVNLAFQASGLISQVAVNPGSVVNKGDIIAKLDNRNQQNNLEQAQIQVKAAQAKYDALKSNSLEAQNIDAAQATLREAQARLDMVKSGNATPDQIAAAQNRVAAAQAKLTGLQAGPDPNQVAAANAALKQAQAKLDQVQNTSNTQAIKAAQARVDAAQANLERVKSSLANAVSQAEQNLTKAKNALDAAQASCNQITRTTCNPATPLINPGNGTSIATSTTNPADVATTAVNDTTGTVNSNTSAVSASTKPASSTSPNANSTTPPVTTVATTLPIATTNTVTTIVGKVVTQSLTTLANETTAVKSSTSSASITTPPVPATSSKVTSTPANVVTPKVSVNTTAATSPTSTPHISAPTPTFTPPEVVTSTLNIIHLSSLDIVAAQPVTTTAPAPTPTSAPPTATPAPPTPTPAPPTQTPVPTVDPNAAAQAQLRLNDAAITYNQAVSTYNDAVAQQTSGLKQAQAEVDAAQADLAQAQTGPNASEVSAAQDEVAQAQALVNDLQQQPKKEDIDAAQAEVNAAQADLNSLQKGGTDKDIALAQASYDKAAAILKQLQQGPTAYEMTQADSALQSANAALRKAQIDLEDTVLRAPFNGIVDKLGITPQQSVRAQEGVVTLSDFSTLKVDSLVSQDQVVRVNTTEQALVRFDSLPKSPALTGRVSYISTQATQVLSNTTTENAAFTVSVLIDNSDKTSPVSLGVRPGMKTSVQIVTSYAVDVLLVPSSTVRSVDNGWVVDVIMPDNNLVSIPIKVGLVGSDGRVEVKTPSLLKPGDKLVVYPPSPTDKKTESTATPTLDVNALNRVRSNATATPINSNGDGADLGTVTPSSGSNAVGTPAPVAPGDTVQPLASPGTESGTSVVGSPESPTPVVPTTDTPLPDVKIPNSPVTAAGPVLPTTASNQNPATSAVVTTIAANSGSGPTLALHIGTPVTGDNNSTAANVTMGRVPGTPNAIPSTSGAKLTTVAASN